MVGWAKNCKVLYFSATKCTYHLSTASSLSPSKGNAVFLVWNSVSSEQLLSPLRILSLHVPSFSLSVLWAQDAGEELCSVPSREFSALSWVILMALAARSAHMASSHQEAQGVPAHLSTPGGWGGSQKRFWCSPWCSGKPTDMLLFYHPSVILETCLT